MHAIWRVRMRGYAFIYHMGALSVIFLQLKLAARIDSAGLTFVHDYDSFIILTHSPKYNYWFSRSKVQSLSSHQHSRMGSVLQLIHGCAHQKKHHSTFKICLGTKPLYLKLEMKYSRDRWLGYDQRFCQWLQLILVQSGPELTQLSGEQGEGRASWYRFCLSLSHHLDDCFITSQKSSPKRPRVESHFSHLTTIME